MAAVTAETSVDAHDLAIGDEIQVKRYTEALHHAVHSQ